MKGRDAGHPHHHPKKAGGGRPAKSEITLSKTHKPDPKHLVSGNPSKPRLDKFARGGTIHIKKTHKGLLHKDTKTPAGEKVPEAKIQAEIHSSDPAKRKRGVFAENAKHWG